MNSDSSSIKPTLLLQNIRSVGKTGNKHSVSILLEEVKPHLMVLTETWANKQLPKLHSQYSSLQTPFSKYRGVALVFQHHLTLTPTLLSLWSEFFLVATWSLSLSQHAVVVGAYLQPASKDVRLLELQRIVQIARTRYPSFEIIIAGDFNMSECEVRSRLAVPEGLHCFTTNGTRQTGETWFTVDFVVSTVLCRGTRLANNFSSSDHWPLLFQFDQLRVKPQEKKPLAPKVRKSVNSFSLISSLLKTTWPLR